MIVPVVPLFFAFIYQFVKVINIYSLERRFASGKEILYGISLLDFISPNRYSLTYAFLDFHQIDRIFNVINQPNFGSNFFITVFTPIFLFAIWVGYAKFSNEYFILFSAIFIIFLISDSEIIVLKDIIDFGRNFLLIPGIIHINRFAITSQVLLVVFFFLLLDRYLMSHNNKKSIFFGLLISCLILLDNIPSILTNTNSEWKTFAIFRQELKSVPNSVILFHPYTYNSRRWLQQVMLDTPMYNSIHDPVRGSDLLLMDSDFENVPCRLIEKRITHVILDDSQASVREKIFKTNEFLFIGSIKAFAYENQRSHLYLFRVKDLCG